MKREHTNQLMIIAPHKALEGEFFANNKVSEQIQENVIQPN